MFDRCSLPKEYVLKHIINLMNINTFMTLHAFRPIRTIFSIPPTDGAVSVMLGAISLYTRKSQEQGTSVLFRLISSLSVLHLHSANSVYITLWFCFIQWNNQIGCHSTRSGEFCVGWGWLNADTGREGALFGWKPISWKWLRQTAPRFQSNSLFKRNWVYSDNFLI